MFGLAFFLKHFKGYLEHTREIMEASKRIQKGYILLFPYIRKAFLDRNYNILLLICKTKEIPELFIIGRPDMTIVAFGSHAIDIFEVNDIMSSKGWHLNALQRPNRWICF